jgi:uncharacterized protein YjeT (DUF2065 family)
MSWQIILYTLGILALIESLLIISFPKQIKKICSQIAKKKYPLTKLGISEFFIGLILVLIAYFLN